MGHHTKILLDDLAALPADRWRAVRYEAFIATPQEQVSRLCQALDLSRDRPLGAALPLSRHTLSTPKADKWRVHAAAIEATARVWAEQNDRALAMLAQTA